MSWIAKVYADLIRKNEKRLEEIPEKLRDEVPQLLDQGNENRD